MSSSPGVRILEADNNKRGDLFGRLMADLFVALGYEFPRLNIHKSGREIDLSADHRLERRRFGGVHGHQPRKAGRQLSHPDQSDRFG